MIDQAWPRANQKTIGETITEPIKRRQKMDKTKKKWVDDFTVLASVDLKQHLVLDPAPVQPVPWRGRHHQVLPVEHNTLKSEIDSIVKYSADRKLLLNLIQITKISKKSFKNPRFKSWFCETDESQIPPARARNRRAAPLLKPVTCRTQRYARSSP